MNTYSTRWSAGLSALKRDQGFTMIELIVVMLILGIVIAIAVPTFSGSQSSGRDSVLASTAQTGLRVAETALSQGEDVEEAVNRASANNADTTLTLTEGHEATHRRGLCVQASWNDADNSVTAGAGCESTSEPKSAFTPVSNLTCTNSGAGAVISWTSVDNIDDSHFRVHLDDSAIETRWGADVSSETTAFSDWGQLPNLYPHETYEVSVQIVGESGGAAPTETVNVRTGADTTSVQCS